MPTKIRLQRRGKKGQAFYHIVIADGRAPRDGKFIERIGIYNPIAKPAEIEIDFDKALDWLKKGAQPTDTVRAILAFKGVMYKNHLLKGVAKGAMTPEQADARFQTWLDEKRLKISSKKNELELNEKDLHKKRLAEEAKVNEAKAAAIAKKLNKLRLDEAAQAAEARASAEAAVELTETPQSEVVVEEPVTEAVAEEPVAEAVAEEPVADAGEIPVAEEEKEAAEAPVAEAAPEVTEENKPEEAETA
jgi:small subunit ribosomal protein S16